MQTIADHRDSASNTAPRTRHAALLAHVADERNWHKQDDCRPAFRAAVRSAELATSVRTWALWLADRFGADGELHRADRAALARWSCITDRTCSRYLAQLERAGLIEREQTARLNRRTRHFDRVVIIRVAEQLRAPERPVCRVEPLTSQKDSSDRLPTLVVTSSGSVGASTTDRRLDDLAATSNYENPVSERERRAVDDDWWHLYRCRTDIPLLRPGYDTNATAERFERERREREHPPPERYDPRPDWLAERLAEIRALGKATT